MLREEGGGKQKEEDEDMEEEELSLWLSPSCKGICLLYSQRKHC